MEENEMTMTAEQIAEMEALKNQTLYGSHVQKIGGCAVVSVDDEVVSLEMPITYPQLVAAIVKKRYSTDQAEAVTANYISIQSNASLTDEKKTEYTTEYEAYQSWRNKAKEVAKEVMGVEA